MAKYIKKMLTKFNMDGCKPRSTPAFEEKSLYTPSKECSFPLKSAVGALQWATTCARPDLAHAVNTLARAGSQKATKSIERCARNIFRYCSGTVDYCIGYSPEAEKEFYDEFTKVGTESVENKNMQEHVKQLDEPVHVFTDASFGTEYKTMKSISGTVIYLYGCPIAWRSKVQTLLTTCTTQSEYVALADAIEFSSTIYGLKQFLLGKPETQDVSGPLWTDNRGAALTARKGILNRDEINKASRHIALRFASVLQHNKRVFWTPTDKQRSDALTKSSNRTALFMIAPWFNKTIPYLAIDDEEEETELTSFFTSCCDPCSLVQ